MDTKQIKKEVNFNHLAGPFQVLLAVPLIIGMLVIVFGIAQPVNMEPLHAVTALAATTGMLLFADKVDTALFMRVLNAAGAVDFKDDRIDDGIKSLKALVASYEELLRNVTFPTATDAPPGNFAPIKKGVTEMVAISQNNADEYPMG